jgi:tRNA A37 threonylcarbamoyladenosine modification protein TsaB
MKFATGSGVPLIALSALTAAAQVEDVLHSKRMVKRGIDADGNYNICKTAGTRARNSLTHVTQPSSTSTTSMLTWMNSAPQAPTAHAQSEAAMVATPASRLFSRSNAQTTKTVFS